MFKWTRRCFNPKKEKKENPICDKQKNQCAGRGLMNENPSTKEEWIKPVNK